MRELHTVEWDGLVIRTNEFYFPVKCARFKDGVERYKALHCFSFHSFNVRFQMSSFFPGALQNILLLPIMEFFVPTVLFCFWAFASFL
jgi:hypothetical protein